MNMAPTDLLLDGMFRARRVALRAAAVFVGFCFAGFIAAVASISLWIALPLVLAASLIAFNYAFPAGRARLASDAPSVASRFASPVRS